MRRPPVFPSPAMPTAGRSTDRSPQIAPPTVASPTIAPQGAATPVIGIEERPDHAVPPRGVALRAAAKVRLFVPSRGWGGRRRREILLGAAAIAVLAHVLIVLGIIAAQRLGPHPQAVLPPTDEPPTIEMIEDQNKYAGGSKPTPPGAPTPPAPPSPAGPPKQQGAPQPSDVPPTPNATDETTPPDAKQQPDAQPDAPTAPPPQPVQQPDVDLDPSDGLGYGHQDDPQIIPASPDSHANKMPAYPRAAGRRGEEGSVQMLVRIGADGAVQGVDVAVSSGHPDLDNTAVKAVSGWHFRPAVRDGVAVPTQMMQVFNYHIDRFPRP